MAAGAAGGSGTPAGPSRGPFLEPGKWGPSAGPQEGAEAGVSERGPPGPGKAALESRGCGSPLAPSSPSVFPGSQHHHHPPPRPAIPSPTWHVAPVPGGSTAHTLWFSCPLHLPSLHRPRRPCPPPAAPPCTHPTALLGGDMLCFSCITGSHSLIVCSGLLTF